MTVYKKCICDLDITNTHMPCARRYLACVCVSIYVHVCFAQMLMWCTRFSCATVPFTHTHTFTRTVGSTFIVCAHRFVFILLRSRSHSFIFFRSHTNIRFCICGRWTQYRYIHEYIHIRWLDFVICNVQLATIHSCHVIHTLGLFFFVCFI